MRIVARELLDKDPHCYYCNCDYTMHHYKRVGNHDLELGSCTDRYCDCVQFLENHWIMSSLYDGDSKE